MEAFDRSFWSPSMLGLIIPVAAAIATGKAATTGEIKAVKEYIELLGMDSIEAQMI